LSSPQWYARDVGNHPNPQQNHSTPGSSKVAPPKTQKRPSNRSTSSKPSGKGHNVSSGTSAKWEYVYGDDAPHTCLWRVPGAQDLDANGKLLMNDDNKPLLVYKEKDFETCGKGVRCFKDWCDANRHLKENESPHVKEGDKSGRRIFCLWKGCGVELDRNSIKKHYASTHLQLQSRCRDCHKTWAQPRTHMCYGNDA